jgi:hypothetical protein
MLQHQDPSDSAFDQQATDALTKAFSPGPAPAHLLRHNSPWSLPAVRGGAAAALLFTVVLSVVALMRPPELVRDAIDHEYYERTLRGNFMPPAELLHQLGLARTAAIPGYPQLMRPCDIGGRLVYHLTTFFEHGGMVTVFAFDRPVALEEGSGWWSNAYWQVVRSQDGKPLLLISQQKKALAVAQARLAKPPAS